MQFQKFTFGMFETNVYIVGDGKHVVVIDPSEGSEAILDVINKEKLIVDYILLTHGHFDHFTGAEYLSEHTHAPILINKNDEIMLSDNTANLSFLSGISPKSIKCDGYLNDGDIIEFGSNKLKVMHTPGHSSGSVSFLGDDVVFSGDLLFYESIGRYDFGNYEDEINSAKKLMLLDDDIIVCPGHGINTTIGHERIFNQYLR